MNLAEFAIRKRVISLICTLLILLAGYVAYTKLPRFEDPEFLIRQANIVVPYPGARADEVAEEVTEVVENALQQLEGVKELRSTSQPGLSRISIEFTIRAARDRAQLNQRFAQLRAKIDDIEGTLPPNALAPQVYDNFGDVFALYFAITGEGYALGELEAYAKTLQRELAIVDGVSKVLIGGTQERVIYVDYAPARLVELGISTAQIDQVLEGQNQVIPGGALRSGDKRLELRSEGAVSSVEAIGNLRISNPQTGASYRLSDIASIREGEVEPTRGLLIRNGAPAIGLAISNETGGNVVNMGEAVRARMDELIVDRPIGVEVQVISDQSVTVKTSINDFVVNVLMALGIVVGTLLIFMGLRSGLLMGGILLVTVAGTLFGMWIYGLDMQRISLGALIIGLGMLVDNAIVVVEGTLVRVSKGESAEAASISVVEQTKWPLLGGTIVGFLAFSPIGFSPDNTGEFAGSLFWTIAIAMLFSWLVAIWLTPYFCTLLMKPTKAAPKPEHGILQGYRRVLNLAIHHRLVTLVLIVAMFASAIIAAGNVPPGFFPASTRAQFVIDYLLPEGSDIHATARDLEEIENHVLTLDGVTGTNIAVGSGHARFMLIYEAEDSNSAYGQILVDVTDYSVIEGLIEKLQPWVDGNYPDANAKIWKFVLGPGGGAKIEAKFFGSDPVVLRELAEEAKRRLHENGAIAVRDDWRQQVQVIRPVINTEAARRLGLTQGEISHALYTHLNGANIGTYRDGDTLVDIVMRPEQAARDSVESLRNVQVFSQAIGGYIPISQVVERFELAFEPANLRRIDRELVIIAQADPKPGVLAGDLFEDIRPHIEDMDLPPGYRMEWGGEFGNSQEANAGLSATMPIGFGAMILVVFFLFNAVRQPLIIWLTVPLAIVGVMWGLSLTQTPMEFMAILGVLSLTGMLIKNAIVLIDETDLQIAGGKPRLQAVADSAVSRVRPVTLGALTTVLGVVPLLWDPFFNSLAVVIICGLSFATVLTLVVVPVLYTLFFRIRMEEV
ncbi:efflux RND transporter permease subunit [Thalassobius sp. MITS945101]|uniref:efflux RND transporter permease subunit n=1 Tax=Thalassobius sp. MITS945101 TaxID=3096994 RepID=UPI00399A1D5F